MVPRAVSCVLLLLVCLVPSPASARHRPLPQIEQVTVDGTAVKSSPSEASRTLTTLAGRSQVRVLGVSRGWIHVQIWASIRGWVNRKNLLSGAVQATPSTYRPPVTHRHELKRGAMPLIVPAEVLRTTRLWQYPGGPVVSSLTQGLSVLVTAWQQDSSGHIWYRIGDAWTPSDNIRFKRVARQPHPTSWQAVTGKGMWLTLGTLTSTRANVLVKAALATGVTHLYVESAISPLGFHGRDSVSALLDAAHRHHLAVIAWVYPYLDDVAADVDLTREVGAFRTSAGTSFDGIAVDLERHVTLWNVHAYSELVRRYLGQGRLLVAVTYPPQAGTDVPFTEIARHYDVIAPMDYWHQTKTSFGLDYSNMRYGADYAFRYATDSLLTIRRAAGTVPIAPIGQTFDNFGRLEMGPYAPSAAEIRGFLEGCRHAGAVGVSFFEWNSATDQEWQVIHDFRYR